MMMFLSMVIALSIHQLMHGEAQRPADAALFAWGDWVTGRLGAGALPMAATLAAPLLLAHWLLGTLDGWLFGLFTLAATAALLLWSLGREDYHTAVERYSAHCDAGDEEAAWLALQSLWTPIAVSDDVTTASEALEQCEQRLLYCGYQRWFAPLFYFLLLGPIAAVAYRLVHLYAAADGGRGYRELLIWLDWAPSRLLALSFAITGDFVAVVRSASLGPENEASMLLRVAAAASAGGELGGRAIRDLLYRTSGLWLLAASAVTIVL